MTWATLIWITALVGFSTALGFVWQWRSGRARATAPLAVQLAEIPPGAGATLLQFSTAFCTACRPTRRVLGAIAQQSPGVQHIEIDLTDRPDLAARFNILQTPTTFVLDAAGVVRSRIGGAPRPDEVRGALNTIASGTTSSAATPPSARF